MLVASSTMVITTALDKAIAGEAIANSIRPVKAVAIVKSFIGACMRM